VVEDFKIKSTAKIVWLGGNLLLIILPNKKGNSWDDDTDFSRLRESFTIQTTKEGEWLVAMLPYVKTESYFLQLKLIWKLI
jgi:hypothetical protein